MVPSTAPVSSAWPLEGSGPDLPAPGRKRSATRRCLVTLATALLLLGAAGCGNDLSGSSTCKDFMNASAESQQKVVDELATKYHKPDYTSPLGRPEVPYFCASNPDTTLNAFFRNAG